MDEVPDNELNRLQQEYDAVRAQNLNLNMFRGKPASAQLDLSNGLFSFPVSYCLKDGTDARNYGVMDGIPECKELFADLLDLDPANMIIGGRRPFPSRRQPG